MCEFVIKCNLYINPRAEICLKRTYFDEKIWLVIGSGTVGIPYKAQKYALSDENFFWKGRLFYIQKLLSSLRKAYDIPFRRTCP